ncbi:LuxR C-terminal-related transcriptional regulator [Kitasatospora sp. NPDC089509]|uniref:LuxR C-terminal-related transcriptional regulator n=1 Tax=Kitasatospora sp. NPDC089509 TaxID=3364079 RepID=UPI00382CE775
MADPELPDAAARDLYRAILAGGGRIRAAEVLPADRAALDRLVELGLLVQQSVDDSYSAVDPRSVAERIRADIRRTGARLLAEADRIPDQLRDLTLAYDTAPRREPGHGGTRIITGKAEIRHQVEQLTQEFPGENLAAQPGAARDAGQLAESLVRTRRFLERGGTIRCLFERDARADAPSVSYAAAASRLGCAIRALDGPFKRFLVFDRAVAVIPADPGLNSAAVVDDPATVAFIVDAFEQLWCRSEVVDWASLADGPPVSAVHEQVGRLLAKGLTQRSIAARLNLSERTVAGHIARLRELYDAETLFQLGWQMRGSRDG